VSGSTFNSRNDAGHSHARAAAASVRNQRPIPAPDPIITISAAATTTTTGHNAAVVSDTSQDLSTGAESPDEPDYVTVEHPEHSESNQVVSRDKASRVLGIKHRKSMEPIPASARASVASVRSVPAPDSRPASHSGPTLPLASLYVVSGLPKSPHTWTLADPDSVLGLHHTEGAVSRWWRPEVLGSTVSPGAGGGKKKRKGKAEDNGTVFSSSGHLSKQEVGKMLSKALKVGSRCVASLRAPALMCIHSV
jgi:EEF1A N-terminal glycine/lysine methyltransferase